MRTLRNIVSFVLATISILALLRSGFHLILHQTLTQILLSAEYFLQWALGPMHWVAEFALARFADFLPDVGPQNDMFGPGQTVVVQPHWKHVFILLWLFMNQAVRATEPDGQYAVTFMRYALALFCAWLAAALAGTVPLDHPNVAIYPFMGVALFVLTQRLAVGARSRDLWGQNTSALTLASAAVLAAGALASRRFSPTDTFLGSVVPSAGVLILFGAVVLLATLLVLGGTGAGSPGRRAARTMGLNILGAITLAWGIVVTSYAFTRTKSETVDILHAVASLKDCEKCPRIRILDAGSVLMGATAKDVEWIRSLKAVVWEKAETPAREFRVERFGISETEVTYAEFAHFVTSSGYVPSGICNSAVVARPHSLNPSASWNSHFLDDVGPNKPVTCVTWWDALAYTNWLSLTTGRKYRLPTEAEWEYASRGGSEDRFYWGSDVNKACTHENVFDAKASAKFEHFVTYLDGDPLKCNDGYDFPAEVRKFKPNGFGLFDMQGNVSEWTLSCYADLVAVNSNSLDGNSSACDRRVVRGGNFLSVEHDIRPAARQQGYPAERDDSLGFRVAVDLPKAHSD